MPASTTNGVSAVLPEHREGRFSLFTQTAVAFGLLLSACTILLGACTTNANNPKSAKEKLRYGENDALETPVLHLPSFNEDIAFDTAWNTQPNEFVAPNEHNIQMLSEAFSTEETEGIYLSVGSDRCLWGALMAKASYALCVDLSKEVIYYNRINAAQLAATRGHSQFLDLRFRVSIDPTCDDERQEHSVFQLLPTEAQRDWWSRAVSQEVWKMWRLYGPETPNEYWKSPLHKTTEHLPKPPQQSMVSSVRAHGPRGSL